jgi:hypothetical protein
MEPNEPIGWRILRSCGEWHLILFRDPRREVGEIAGVAGEDRVALHTAVPTRAALALLLRAADKSTLAELADMLAESIGCDLGVLPSQFSDRAIMALRATLGNEPEGEE